MVISCRIIEHGFTKDTGTNIIPYDYVTTFTYNGKGQVLSIDGPLPGNSDTTSLSYDAPTGDLVSITRPLIGSTSLGNYDAAGQAGRITDVNSQSAYLGDGTLPPTWTTPIPPGNTPPPSPIQQGLRPFSINQRMVLQLKSPLLAAWILNLNMMWIRYISSRS